MPVSITPKRADEYQRRLETFAQPGTGGRADPDAASGPPPVNPLGALGPAANRPMPYMWSAPGPARPAAPAQTPGTQRLDMLVKLVRGELPGASEEELESAARAVADPRLRQLAMTLIAGRGAHTRREQLARMEYTHAEKMEGIRGGRIQQEGELDRLLGYARLDEKERHGQDMIRLGEQRNALTEQGNAIRQEMNEIKKKGLDTAAKKVELDALQDKQDRADALFKVIDKIDAEQRKTAAIATEQYRGMGPARYYDEAQEKWVTSPKGAPAGAEAGWRGEYERLAEWHRKGLMKRMKTAKDELGTLLAEPQTAGKAKAAGAPTAGRKITQAAVNHANELWPDDEQAVKRWLREQGYLLP